MRVAVILNPVAGPRRGRGTDSAMRLDAAARWLREAGAHATTGVTRGPGHAFALAREALAGGADVVCAWGGDGTVNEVASALAGSAAALAIVPAGSGNGLARALGLPRALPEALRVATGSNETVIDGGRADDRWFFNVAGFGFDAHVAGLFNRSTSSRGLATYVRVCVRELWRYRPPPVSLDTGENVVTTEALLIAVANSPQYGNGAVIAPDARLDDGVMDLVVVGSSPSPPGNLWRARRLFMGTLACDPLVSSRHVTQVRVSSTAPLRYHVDGDVVQGGASVDVRVLPRALRVRVPARGGRRTAARG